VAIEAGGRRGFGYTYADAATARFIDEHLRPLLEGCEAGAIPARWLDMNRAVRNFGRAGVASMALSAVDIALWDLKAKLLDAPLAMLLGMARRAIPAYASGGFTSYPLARLRQQLGDWVARGFRRVKMKVGADPDADEARVRAARAAVGPDTQLFVDANGAYTLEQAIGFARRFGALDVRWFEEPVSSDHLRALREIRARRPGHMAISAGEYGYDAFYFRRMLAARAVDVLQADATRCGGVTGFLQAAALADAWGVPLSSHCAPALHVPLCCAAVRAVHLEYFHDHARIEHALFEGMPRPDGGMLAPELSRTGLGVALKQQEAACYAVS
jgi:L-alanine-DL-glutamate epimerase-like enolase superfamily enzyme